MKRIVSLLSVTFLVTSFSFVSYSQKAPSGAATINASDLESHLSFLASPLLKGRLNGSPELEIAANYLASQAKKIGLKPVNGNSYLYPYTVIEKSLDREKTVVSVKAEGSDPVMITEPLYQLMPQVGSDFELEGEVIFAGYGIKADEYGYDDFDTLNVKGKILLIMTRAPMNDDGKTTRFSDQKWLGISYSLQYKMRATMSRGPKAILVVCDPKSDASSVDGLYPGFAESLGSSMSLKGKKEQTYDFPGMPKFIFVHRKVADELLKGTGKTLAGLQDAIDSDLKSHSFLLSGKTIRIKEVSISQEKQMPNVAGIVEGSDPVLKNEVVIFSGHMDHLGGSGENIKPGADDNASGCSAILELAEAFNSLPKKPLRSVMFLWVSGEEVGLFGSQAYVDNPVFPLDKTVADLNMDMIGRNKGPADTTARTPMTGPGEVFVITDDQSRELVAIAGIAAEKNKLSLDYGLSGKDHPEMMFARSDHFNFVKHDIPVLFFMTGLHADYHKTTDVIEKIDFKKMETITKMVFDIGYTVANKKARVVVDNPFSKWPNNPFKMM